jgi:hypothetical protein
MMTSGTDEKVQLSAAMASLLFCRRTSKMRQHGGRRRLTASASNRHFDARQSAISDQQ